MTDAPPTFPAEWSDGRYWLHVDAVDRDGEPTATVRVDDGSAAAAAEPGDRAVVPAAALPEPAPVFDPGAVVEASVEDGAIVEAAVDVDRTIRRGAGRVADDEFAVPLRGAGALDAPTHPNVTTLARDRSVLVVGEPGAGRATFMELLVPQLGFEDDEPVVVFDFAGELKGFLEWQFPDRRIVELSPNDASVAWNLFEEVDDEEEFGEVGRLMFPDEDDFFDRAARQVFVATCRYLYREGEEAGLEPDNKELVDFFQRFSSDEVYELMTEHEDLKGPLSAIDPTADRQAAGVWATLQQRTEDMFVGDLVQKDGEWSIADYVSGDWSTSGYAYDSEGHVLLLDYPVDSADSVRPVYRFLVDWAVRCGLASPETRTHYVLDDIAHLPAAAGVRRLVAAGRAQNCQAVLGLRGLSQLEERLSRSTARSLLCGVTQEVFFRTGDPRTVDYVDTRLGPEASGADVQRLDDRETFVLAADSVVRGRIPAWDDLSPETRETLAGRPDERLDRET